MLKIEWHAIAMVDANYQVWIDSHNFFSGYLGIIKGKMPNMLRMHSIPIHTLLLWGVIMKSPFQASLTTKLNVKPESKSEGIFSPAVGDMKMVNSYGAAMQFL